MAWSSPKYSRAQVDAAGRLIVSPSGPLDDIDTAFAVLSNWRSAHAFPLNTFQVGLRQRARRIDPRTLVAQRLKRTPSILGKLQRFPRMRLSQMQDIGGCRAVLRTVPQVRRLESAFLRAPTDHEMVTHKDYITTPKASGYRGVHFVYRYKSSRSATFNGLLIEVQLRSRIQHSWATAVETVGTLVQHALKASEGPEQWLRFFALTSSAFALLERSPTIPDAPTGAELRRAIRSEASALRVHQRLRSYRSALKLLEDVPVTAAQYYLLSLQPSQERLEISGFRTDQLELATQAYLEKERTTVGSEGAEVVLVRSESLDALRRAYPNYFLDTEVFLRHLDRVITHALPG